MKPARFDYQRPSDIAGALALLGERDAVSKIIAGGQSLGPMLNMRLVQPDLVVDVTAIPDLVRVEREPDGLVIGACVTHADIEDGRVPDVTGGAMPMVARGIAYRAVRSRGTLGGSLTNADPSADWVSALAALGATVLLRHGRTGRTLPVEDYVRGALEPALEPGEILEGVRVPRTGRGARWGYTKVCRKTGEYAHAIGAILVDPERGVCRAVIGAIAAKPLLFADARVLFAGDAGPASFRPEAADRALSEAGMADAIDRRVHVVTLRRAVEKAFA